MNVEDTITLFTHELLNAKNLEHTKHIINKYFEDQKMSLRKKKKLFFLTLFELKEERKNLRKLYLENKEDQDTAVILSEEDLLKKKCQLLKLYCNEIKAIQRKLRLTYFNMNTTKKYTVIKEKNYKEINFEEIDVLKNKKCRYYLDCLQNKKPVLIRDKEAYILTYKYFIRNYDLLEYKDVILEYTKQLIDVISSLEEERAVVELTSLIDNIKYKKMENSCKSDLNKKLEKEILKYIKKELKQKLTNISWVTKKEYDYRIDILGYLIYNPGNYYYIKKVLQEIPEVINLKTKEDDYITRHSKFIENTSEEHMLTRIVKLFVYNLEIELRSQDPNYINRDYYKQIYFLYINNPNLKLEEEDKKEITNVLDNILNHLYNNRYEETRKNKAINDILSMKENIQGKNFEHKNVMNEALEQELEYMPYRRNSELASKTRVNLTTNHLLEVQKQVEDLKAQEPELYDKEIARRLNVETTDVKNSFLFSDTVMFDKNSFAYSIAHDSEYNYYFRIHAFDMTNYINEESSLESDLYNGIYKLNKKDLKLRLDLGHEEPVITYQFKILRNGYISSFKMFNSIISPDIIYNDSDLKEYRNNETLKDFVSIYRLVNKTDKEQLTTSKFNNFWEELISNNILNYTSKSDIPFITHGQSDLTELDYLNNNPELCYLLSKVDKHTYKIILKIIKDCNNIEHYSLNSFGKANILGSLNYERYLNQKIIRDIINMKTDDKIKEKYLEECNNVLNALNNSIGYISIEENKAKKKLK